jgi:hypothetical protein
MNIFIFVLWTYVGVRVEGLGVDFDEVGKSHNPVLINVRNLPAPLGHTTYITI